MKKTTLLTALAIVACSSAFSQGTVNFVTKVTGGINQQVFAPDPGSPGVQRVGNTSSNSPAGTQTYAGAALTGSGWTAQLWAAPGAVIPAGQVFAYGTIDSSLQACTPLNTFRAGANAGSVPLITATTAVNVPKDAPAAVFQMRVFPTSFGSWANAVAAYGSGNQLAAIGASPMVVINQIGGDVNTPASLLGLQSFSLVVPVPEPSSFALAGMGLASLLIFRRRK